MDRAILVRQWLTPGLEVDDAQPPGADDNTIIGVAPLFVCSSMGEQGEHLAHQALVSIPEPVGRDDAGDAAHLGSHPRESRTTRPIRMHT